MWAPPSGTGKATEWRIDILFLFINEEKEGVAEKRGKQSKLYMAMLQLGFKLNEYPTMKLKTWKKNLQHIFGLEFKRYSD